MRLGITVTYHSGEQESATVLPPEWIKWETKTGRKISDVSNDHLGISDLAFLAYSAIKREKAGSPIKPFDAWIETIEDLQILESERPKVTRVGALEG